MTRGSLFLFDFIYKAQKCRTQDLLATHTQLSCLLTFLEIQSTEQSQEMPLGLYWRCWIFERKVLAVVWKKNVPLNDCPSLGTDKELSSRK